MFSTYASPSKMYQTLEVESSVENAKPLTLVVMLYDGAIRNINEAIIALSAGNIPAKCAAIGKAIRIIEEGLRASLDRKVGKISTSLNELYQYMCNRLLIGHVKNDAAPLREVIDLLTPLRDAWRTLEQGRN